jgi:surface antigen
MNKVLKAVGITLLAASFLTGCVRGAGGNAVGGTLLGAAGGGLLGSQFGSGKGQLAMVALGVLGGSLIGNHIGSTMDAQDAHHATQTFESAPTNQTVAWQNPNTGDRHAVTPTRTYQTDAGYCREFTHTVTVAGRKQQAYGTACRQPDGTWKVQQ